MNKNMRKRIKALNSVCGIVGGVVFLGELAFLLLRMTGLISNGVLIIGMFAIALCWWTIYGIKYFMERKLINELKNWAQRVVDTNYYHGKQITVDCRRGVWFSGPEDSWFRKKFIARCRELFSDTGMKIYYNYSWIRM